MPHRIILLSRFVAVSVHIENIFFLRMGKRKIVSCAPCRVQRKKCAEECILAPYFPPDDPDKFAIVQRVFGTGHIIKLLQVSFSCALVLNDGTSEIHGFGVLLVQGLEAEKRADAVNSIVYEASARLKDPVHGCAKEIDQLQKQIAGLESQLAVKQAELKDMRSEYDNLVLLVGTASLDSQLVQYPTFSAPQPREDGMYDEVDPLLSWGLLWEE
ncbi:LOB domain-containing protein 1-like [Cryptomeria japonica]|uniref:LOB domain-containing protein 1-like n=1 Tax=Cryptomeria japonica TaxID=3369 RepID=UPI0025ACC905|nr:LOB domain-containing protein 1-like [Cryptomeria japonica]